jgi:peroxiredoxin
MKLSFKHFVIISIVLALGVAFAISLSTKPTAPAVEFTSLEGKKVALQSLRDKVVLVNFWATDCPGCVVEMPQLMQTYKKYQSRGLEVYAVAMSYDPPNYVMAYAKNNALPFPVALDPQGQLAKAFKGVQLIPTTFVIDKQGRIIQQTVGVLDFNKLHALLDKELKPAL